jgi:MaoC like domain
MTYFKDFDELKAFVGQDLVPTPYLTVTQDMINGFADATFDSQWIHVDPEKAKNGPFKTPIAHGFLILSLASKFAAELFEVDGRVRLKAKLKRVEDYPNNGVKIEIDGAIELEGSKRPVVIFEWVVLEFQ